MNFLEKIVAHKQKETELRKAIVPVSELERSPLFLRQTQSLSHALMASGSSGIIAEFKRASPSRGTIHPGASPEKIAQAYENCGASGISVLTETTFFNGSTDDLQKARSVTSLPLLRKDFITDEYQVIETRAIGADVILLIAGVPESKKIKALASLAKELGLEVLFEIHHRDEIRKIPEEADMIGVNNRNLNTFTVDIRKALELAPLLPPNVVKVSESGLSIPETVITLKEAGYQGFLIGETFMKTSDPGKTCRQFIEKIKIQYPKS